MLPATTAMLPDRSRLSRPPAAPTSSTSVSSHSDLLASTDADPRLVHSKPGRFRPRTLRRPPSSRLQSSDEGGQELAEEGVEVPHTKQRGRHKSRRLRERDDSESTAPSSAGEEASIKLPLLGSPATTEDEYGWYSGQGRPGRGFSSGRGRRQSRTTVSSVLAGTLPGRFSAHLRSPKGPRPPHPALHRDSAASSSSSSTQPAHHFAHRVPPSHRPKRKPPNVDFRFPVDFNSSGLPHFSHNHYLPARLQKCSERDLELRVYEEEVGREQDMVLEHSRAAEGGDNIVFAAVLAFLLVVLPALVICGILGAIFVGVNGLA